MGGLRAFISEKSTVLTTPGNKAFYEKFVPELKVETFDKKQTISDGERTVELVKCRRESAHGRKYRRLFSKGKISVSRRSFLLQQRSDLSAERPSAGDVFFRRMAQEKQSVARADLRFSQHDVRFK